MNEYLELNYYNTTDEDQPVEFKNRRSSSVIDDTDTPYNVSAIRFSCDSHNIPIFIPHIQAPRRDIFINPTPPSSSQNISLTKSFPSNINAGGTSIKYTKELPTQYDWDNVLGIEANFLTLIVEPFLPQYIGFGYGYFVPTLVRIIEHNNEAVFFDFAAGHPEIFLEDLNGDGTQIYFQTSNNPALTPSTLYRVELYLEFYNSPVALSSTNFVGYSIQSFNLPYTSGASVAIHDVNFGLYLNNSLEKTFEVREWSHVDNGNKEDYVKYRYNNNNFEIVLSNSFKTNGNHEFRMTGVVNKHLTIINKYQPRYIGFDAIPTLSDYNALMDENETIDETPKEIEVHELNTDMQVALEYSPNNDGVYYWNGEYIRWQPENNFLKQPPAPYDRYICCANPFFHAHSLKHISKLISSALTRLFNYFGGNSWSSFTSQMSGKEIEIEQVDNRLGLLIPWEIFGNPKWRIVVNGKLKRYFGFHTVPHETWPDAHVIVFDIGTISKTALGYGASGNMINYGVILEQYRSSCMFPFRSIIFKAINFPINSLQRYTNAMFSSQSQFENENITETIITDLLLNVSDLNNFYDKISYIPTTFDRKISLMANYISNITIICCLETTDGVIVPLTIPHNGQATIMLQFTPA